MLVAGVPMLLLPDFLERFLLAIRIDAMGAGITVNPDMPPPDFMVVIHRLLEEPGYRENARRFAEKYAGFNQDEQQENIVARIEEIAVRK